MTVYYFGADKTWEDLKKFGFRRRNTCILKALSESRQVKRVFVIRKTTRAKWIKWFFSRSKNNDKVSDILFFSLLPGALTKRLGLQAFEKKLNARLISTLTNHSPSSKDTLIWSYWPGAYLISRDVAMKGTRVFDSDHNIIDDPNIAEDQKAIRKALLLDIAEHSDILLSSVRSMLSWFDGNGFSKSVRLRNGVEAKRFVNSQSAERTADKQITIGYCGTLSKWIDYNLFGELIRRNPNWTFLIVGKPYRSKEAGQLVAPNVTFLGEKKSSEIPAIMASFDIGINLYLPHPALDVDSMKLYEYLAAEIPVISTPFHSFIQEDFEDLITVALTVEQIEAAIEEYSTKKFKVNKGDVAAFLEKSSWSNRVDEFLNMVNSNNGGQ